MAQGEESEMRCRQDKTPVDWSRGERNEAEQRKIGLVSNGAQGPHADLFFSVWTLSWD